MKKTKQIGPAWDKNTLIEVSNERVKSITEAIHPYHDFYITMMLKVEHALKNKK